MERDRITARQLSAATWAAVLAPAVSILPGATARQAGVGSWLAPLAALPAALWLGWLLTRLSRRGLTKTFMRVLGRRAGSAFTIIYIMWAVLLGSARLRLSGRRLLFTARQETGLWFFLLVLAALAIWMAQGKVAAFVRAAAVFSRILALALVAVLGVTVFQIRGEHLILLWGEDILPTLKGAVSVLGVLCYGIYAAFLWDGGDTETGGRRRIAGACGVLVLMQMAVLGNLGAELSARLEDPFLTLSKQVGVEGAFQRVESLVAAVWLLGDLALLGLLLCACRRMVWELAPHWDGRLVAAAGGAAILAGALLAFRDPLLAQKFESGPALAGNLLLGLMIPAVLAGMAGSRN